MRIEFVDASLPVEKVGELLVLCMADGHYADCIGSCRLFDWHEHVPAITSLVVAEAHRRKGVATQIIGACIQKAQEAGKSTIRLTVKTANKDAYRLYKKLGFRLSASSKDDNWMVKFLDNPLPE